MRVLAFDPGLALLGWSFLEGSSDAPKNIQFGCIRTEAGLPLARRLVLIYDELHTLFDRFHPEVVAMEILFFSKNVKTLAQVGHARGVIVLVAGQMNAEVFEYAPRQVKMALTGYGSADKKQMQQVVQRTLGLSEIPKPDDAADAVAVGLCHMQYSQSMGKTAVTV